MSSIALLRNALYAFATIGPFLVAAPAAAEQWVETPFHLTIDVDSIRKADGLVYYIKKHINLISDHAFDCVRRIKYFVQQGRSWRTEGKPVSAGTIGAEAMNFVCSRARQKTESETGK